MNWIENFQEAQKLYLCWQAPENSKDRTHWAVGYVSLLENGDFELRYFSAPEEFSLHNGGKQIEELEILGYSRFPAFGSRNTQRIYQDGVKEAFMRRLPPRRRPDFAEFLEKFRLKPTTEMSDFSLLARTEGKSPGDNFSFVDPLCGYDQPCDFMLEIAGYRHYSASVRGSIKPGQTLSLCLDPNNPYDRNAVKVLLGDDCIGYVNRLQAASFSNWVNNGSIQAVVERLNGTKEHPRAFMFLRIQ